MSNPNLPYAPAVPSQAPPRRRWLPWVIVAGSLGVVALLWLALTLFVNGVSSLARPAQGDPLISGEPAIPNAAPLDCVEPCFTEADIEATVLSEAELDEWGITQHDFPWKTYDPTTADELYRAITAQWKANEGTPDSCIFVIGNSPSVIDLESDAGALDHIEYTGEHATQRIETTIEQSVRVFSDTASAASYMNTLYDQINDCSEVSMGPPDERYTAEVTAAPALTLPQHVAGVGWVRTGDPGPRWRAYTFDLQVGNLVVRTRLMTDGTFDEEGFRVFLMNYAYRLEGLTPAAE